MAGEVDPELLPLEQRQGCRAALPRLHPALTGAGQNGSRAGLWGCAKSDLEEQNAERFYMRSTWGGETLGEEAARSSSECSAVGRTRGRVGRGTEQPGLVKGGSAYGGGANSMSSKGLSVPKPF